MDTEFYFTFAEPLVCTAIHDGHDVSPAIKKNLAIPEDVRLREEDPRTGFFTRIAANRIVQYKSRFEYDLNRSREKAFYLKPEDAWGLRVRRETPAEEVIEKSLSDYDTFYRRTEIFLNEMLRNYDNIFVYDIHSYNHHRKGAAEPFDDPEKNPEIILGTSNMPERWLPLVEEIRDSLLRFDFQGRKLDVRINVKFPGGHFPRWIHKTFEGRISAVAIEFKKIFMNEWTGEFYRGVMHELRTALRSTKPLILKRLRSQKS